MADNKKIQEFFKGNEIKYEAKVGKAKVSLTLQHQEEARWKRGIDHLCYANLNIEFLIGYTGKANRNPSLKWEPVYLHVESINFDGLFENMHNYAECFSEILSRRSSNLSAHTLRRAFDSIEDKVKEDFDSKEFKEYFINPDAPDD
jgi:hypothetical protein